MRRTLGWILFIVGIIVLCWWAATHQGKKMQAEVTSEAEGLTEELNASAPSTELHSSVSGRDIELTGAVPADQLDAVKQQYMDLKGRRVVRADALMGIETMSPYIYDASKQDADYSAKGYAPTPSTQAALNAELANASSTQIDLAAGAPDNWADAVTAGNAALGELTYGSLKIVDQDVTLTGFAPDEATKTAVEAALNALPANFKVTSNVKMPIQGPDFTADFDITKGLTIAGTTTEDGTAERVAEDLAAPIANADLKADNQGSIEPDEARLRHIGTFLSRFDKAEITVYGEQVNFNGEATKGGMNAQDREAFKAGFAEGDEIVINDSTPDANAKRSNILNGQNEYFAGGYWLPVVEIDVSASNCDENTLNLMNGQTINFVTGSAQLDPVSTGVINSLSALLNACLSTGTLELEIGGHTDSDGDTNANQVLSQDRAAAVRDAIAERGVEIVNVTVVGYGESQPIADNTSPEGKAKNRRTTFIWRDLN